MTGAHRVFGSDVGPWIRSELLQPQGHLAIFPVERQDNSFKLISNLDKVLCGAQVGRPGHFRYVNEAFNAFSHFQECAVICNYHNLAFNLIPYLNLIAEGIPWMLFKLLET